MYILTQLIHSPLDLLRHPINYYIYYIGSNICHYHNVLWNPQAYCKMDIDKLDGQLTKVHRLRKLGHE